MKVTVAICTWNRAKLLDQTLAQMRNLRIPHGIQWELLVVNNNSPDHTDSIIASHSKSLPIRRLFEPKQGQCNARNCAIDAANGDLIVWTDDDVLVGKEWLSEYAKAACNWPKASFFGGTIDPWFAETPPRWIKDNLDRISGAFAIRQAANDVRRIESSKDFPYGANMAFQRDALRSHRFDPSIGLCGDQQMRGDEWDVLSRMTEDGHFGVWVGPAKVRHFIPQERLTKTYLWNYFHGIGSFAVRRNDAPNGPRCSGVPRHVWRAYYENRAKCLFFSPTKGRRWLSAFVGCAKAKGKIDAFRAKRGCRVDSERAPQHSSEPTSQTQ